ncbi:hypothetical protein BLNAU_5727 [Blattamonas nauphoetae]|uniref:Uncharacterized protein n=1 Tax=Blattamonas nauphoetae TaxID=2049346 RepID=A0ABQ9Y6S7_9EUKA|nr:hypothetical protein BLNAU_5727 [Blattamonas nauphoetae]
MSRATPNLSNQEMDALIAPVLDELVQLNRIIVGCDPENEEGKEQLDEYQKKFDDILNVLKKKGVKERYVHQQIFKREVQRSEKLEAKLEEELMHIQRRNANTCIITAQSQTINLIKPILVQCSQNWKTRLSDHITDFLLLKDGHILFSKSSLKDDTFIISTPLLFRPVYNIIICPVLKFINHFYSLHSTETHPGAAFYIAGDQGIGKTSLMLILMSTLSDHSLKFSYGKGTKAGQIQNFKLKDKRGEVLSFVDSRDIDEDTSPEPPDSGDVSIHIYDDHPPPSLIVENHLYIIFTSPDQKRLQCPQLRPGQVCHIFRLPTFSLAEDAVAMVGCTPTVPLTLLSPEDMQLRTAEQHLLLSIEIEKEEIAHELPQSSVDLPSSSKNATATTQLKTLMEKGSVSLTKWNSFLKSFRKQYNSHKHALKSLFVLPEKPFVTETILRNILSRLLTNPSGNLKPKEQLDIIVDELVKYLLFSQTQTNPPSSATTHFQFNERRMALIVCDLLSTIVEPKHDSVEKRLGSVIREIRAVRNRLSFVTMMDVFSFIAGDMNILVTPHSILKGLSERAESSPDLNLHDERDRVYFRNLRDRGLSKWVTKGTETLLRQMDNKEGVMKITSPEESVLQDVQDSIMKNLDAVIGKFITKYREDTNIVNESKWLAIIRSMMNTILFLIDAGIPRKSFLKKCKELRELLTAVISKHEFHLLKVADYPQNQCIRDPTDPEGADENPDDYVNDVKVFSDHFGAQQSLESLRLPRTLQIGTITQERLERMSTALFARNLLWFLEIMDDLPIDDACYENQFFTNFLQGMNPGDVVHRSFVDFMNTTGLLSQRNFGLKWEDFTRILKKRRSTMESVTRSLQKTCQSPSPAPTKTRLIPHDKGYSLEPFLPLVTRQVGVHLLLWTSTELLFEAAKGAASHASETEKTASSLNVARTSIFGPSPRWLTSTDVLRSENTKVLTGVAESNHSRMMGFNTEQIFFETHTLNHMSSILRHRDHPLATKPTELQPTMTTNDITEKLLENPRPCPTFSESFDPWKTSIPEVNHQIDTNLPSVQSTLKATTPATTASTHDKRLRPLHILYRHPCIEARMHNVHRIMSNHAMKRIIPPAQEYLPVLKSVEDKKNVQYPNKKQSFSDSTLWSSSSGLRLPTPFSFRHSKPSSGPTLLSSTTISNNPSDITSFLNTASSSSYEGTDVTPAPLIRWHPRHVVIDTSLLPQREGTDSFTSCIITFLANTLQIKQTASTSSPTETTAHITKVLNALIDRATATHLNATNRISSIGLELLVSVFPKLKDETHVLLLSHLLMVCPSHQNGESRLDDLVNHPSPKIGLFALIRWFELLIWIADQNAKKIKVTKNKSGSMPAKDEPKDFIVAINKGRYTPAKVGANLVHAFYLIIERAIPDDSLIRLFHAIRRLEALALQPLIFTTDHQQTLQELRLLADERREAHEWGTTHNHILTTLIVWIDKILTTFNHGSTETDSQGLFFAKKRIQNHTRLQSTAEQKYEKLLSDNALKSNEVDNWA